MSLYGAKGIDFTQEQIKKLQIIENSVDRKILGAKSYTQEAAVRVNIAYLKYEE